MQKWSIAFRLWHWIHALVVLGMIATVFLRKTFLSYKANSEIIAAKLSGMDILLTSEQAKIIAKAVRAPMWEWHILLGYALAVLLLIRLGLFFTKSGRSNFVGIGSSGLHKKMVKIGYMGIYLVLAFMSVSGLALTFSQELALADTTAHTIKEVHEAVFNLVWVFVLLHIGGLIVAEQGEESGLVSDMINGGR